MSARGPGPQLSSRSVNNPQMLVFVLTTSSMLPKRGGASDMLEHAMCELVWRDFGHLEDSVAVYERSVEELFSYHGTRLGGSAKLDPMTVHFNETGAGSHIASNDGNLHVGECVVDAPGGGTWHTQRIGPFLSTGGFDWWNVYHRDFATARMILNDLGEGEQAGITGHVTGPVNTAGDLIPLPPIHNHHVHIVPGLGILHGMPEVSHLPECLLWGRKCSDGSVIIQHHGDYQCIAEEGGTECFGRDYPSHVKLFSEPLAISAQLNDARPAGSAPLVWWYQVALRINVAEGGVARLPISAHVMGQPIKMSMPPQDFATMDVPADRDSFAFYTGRMPFAGTISGVDWHSHQLKFQSSFMAGAAPRDLGLEAAGFQPRHVYDAIITSEAGFPNNTVLRQHMLNQLARASSRGLASGSLVFESFGRTEFAGGTRFDRMAHTSCSPWAFIQSEQFTIVGFSGPHEPSPGPMSSAPVFAGMAGSTSDAMFQQHYNPYVSYAADDGISHYTSQGYSQTVDAVDLAVTRTDELRTLLQHGTPKEPPTRLEHVTVAMILALLYFVDGPDKLLLVIVGIAGLARWTRGCCSYRALIVVFTSLYIVVVVNVFLIPGHLFIGADHASSVLLASKMDRATETGTTQLTLVAIGGALLVPILRTECRAPKPKKITASAQLV